MEPGRRDTPAVTFETDTFELLLLRRPDRDAGHNQATVRRLQQEHIAYLFAQQAAGKLLAAGAIADHPTLTGMGLFATGSLDEARRIMDEDPAVRAGVDAYEVMTFVCPRGSFGFPRSGS